MKRWLLLLAIVATALVIGACSSDDETTNTLTVNAESAGSMDISGITWLETCSLDSQTGEFVIATMILAQTGTRTETVYSDAGCTTETSTSTFALTVTDDGTKDVVAYVDEFGAPAAAPTGFTLPTTATKITISGTVGGETFSFTTLVYINDLVTPLQILFGDDESVGAPTDASGYPDNMFSGGPEQQ